MDRPTSQPKDIKQLGHEKLLRPLIKSASGLEKLSSRYTLAGVNAVKEQQRDWGLNRAVLDRFPIKITKSEVSRLPSPSIPSAGIVREPISPVFPRETGHSRHTSGFNRLTVAGVNALKEPHVTPCWIECG